MEVFGDTFHHQHLNWNFPLANCFILMTSLFLLEQVEDILFIMYKLLGAGLSWEPEGWLEALLWRGISCSFNNGKGEGKPNGHANRDGSVQPLSSELLCS